MLSINAMVRPLCIKLRELMVGRGIGGLCEPEDIFLATGRDPLFWLTYEEAVL